MIHEIKIVVGGSEIEQLDADRIFVPSRIDLHNEKKTIWDEMVGHIPELVDPENGI